MESMGEDETSTRVKTEIKVQAAPFCVFLSPAITSSIAPLLAPLESEKVEWVTIKTFATKIEGLELHLRTEEALFVGPIGLCSRKYENERTPTSRELSCFALDEILLPIYRSKPFRVDHRERC